MREDLKKQAKKNHRAKQDFYITCAVFVAISIILLVVSTVFEGTAAAFWIRLPILVLALAIGIVYLSMFGYSLKAFSDKTSWEEEQIEKEMRRLYQQRKNELPPGEELPEEDILELKELERLKRKWYDHDELV
jgi:archaellum biogenesis protein FlaJ (TadC family)